MSKVLAIETQPGVGPVVRVMNDASYDPVSTLPTEFGKMQFDSRTTKISYVWDIYIQSYDPRFNNGGTDRFYGFDNNTYDVVVSQGSGLGTLNTRGAGVYWNNAGSGLQTYWLWKEWWPFGYLPIVEMRTRYNKASGVFDGAKVTYTFFDGVDGQYGLVQSSAAYTGTTKVIPLGSGVYREGYEQLTKNSNPDIIIPTLFAVIQLPQRDDPIPDFATTVIAGQRVLNIDNSMARMALPGRDVFDTNPDHYVFHENKIPAKIMRSGDVNIAGNGTANLICPFPLTETTYMDFMVKKQADTEFWHPPFFNGTFSAGNYAFNYQVQSDRVVITNLTSTAITVRYVIFADSDAAYTTGGTKVLIDGNDGTQNFIQIKRPGSSDTAPSINDIILDTRLAYMPIMAEGYLNWPGDFPTVISGSERYKGERMATVTVSNPNPKLKLFPKQIVVFDPMAQPASYNGIHNVFADNTGGWIGRASSISSWANVRADESAVDFYMSGDNPQYVQAGGAATYVRKIRPGNTPQDIGASGLRYYIFGIPQSL